MRVSICKSNGLLIEAQSNDAAEYGALIENAIAAGFSADQVQEKVVTEKEYELLLSALPSQAIADPVVTMSQLRVALTSISGVSEDQVDAAISAAASA